MIDKTYPCYMSKYVYLVEKQVTKAKSFYTGQVGVQSGDKPAMQ